MGFLDDNGGLATLLARKLNSKTYFRRKKSTYQLTKLKDVFLENEKYIYNNFVIFHIIINLNMNW